MDKKKRNMLFITIAVVLLILWLFFRRSVGARLANPDQTIVNAASTDWPGAQTGNELSGVPVTFNMNMGDTNRLGDMLLNIAGSDNSLRLGDRTIDFGDIDMGDMLFDIFSPNNFWILPGYGDVTFEGSNYYGGNYNGGTPPTNYNWDIPRVDEPQETNECGMCSGKSTVTESAILPASPREQAEAIAAPKSLGLDVRMYSSAILNSRVRQAWQSQQVALYPQTYSAGW